MDNLILKYIYIYIILYLKNGKRPIIIMHFSKSTCFLKILEKNIRRLLKSGMIVTTHK
jgi:hypothetical protein